ncbi:S8 family serine peptidase [Streptomyces yanii]|uniref:S8 family serine peptidase n=1 Tax=Streptomyces yanii TaxID=78510 RepID=UPI0031EC405E
MTASRSFVSGETAQDGHGHGTHVADTVAGTGANSDGRYKGVAPGADLLIGKVLNNAGTGATSEILAGMDWAVGQGADIVNMSLGAAVSAPGGDVLSEAVDALSDSSETLFVIAAGNSGPGASTLGSPGIADSALTVGAVDKSDVLASFSSRGPRLGDNAVKPDITAPGVGIVAARAKGTAMGTPVDEHYTSANGTSMATPHVAGAAAVLAQRHPDWTGRRIKDALTAHARTSAAHSPFQQGYGRVDIPAALDPALELSGRADFGLLDWQKGTYPKQTRTLTFRNSGTADTTVNLTTAVKTKGGAALADGALTLSGPGMSDGRLTLPAGGSAEVTVTLNPNLVTPDTQATGYITATAAGGETVRTPVAFTMAPEHHDVTVDFKDRFGGTPAYVVFTAHGMDNSTWEHRALLRQGSTTLSLPVGRFSIEGLLNTGVPGDPKRYYATDAFDLPNITVTDRDQTLTVDGTEATDLTVKVDGEKRPLERGVWMLGLTRDDGAGGHTNGIYDSALLNGAEARIGAVPSERADTGTLRLFSFLAQREPIARLSVTGPEETVIPVAMPNLAPRFEGTKKLRLVDAGTGSAEDFASLDATGKAALISVADPRVIDDQVRQAAEAGAAAVIVAPTTQGPLSNGTVSAGLAVPVVVTGHDSGRSLLGLLGRGEVTVALSGVLESGYTYSTPFVDDGRLPASMAKTVDADDFVTLDNTLHAGGSRTLGREDLQAWAPNQPTSVRVAQYVTMGAAKDDYQLAGPQTYSRSVFASTQSNMRMAEPMRSYPEPRKTYREHWNGAPTRQSAYESGYCNFCRSDVWTRVSVTVGDSDPTHRMPSGAPKAEWRFYRDGEQVAETAVMVPQKADYRFVQDLTRAQDHPGVALGGKVHTEWSFTSAAPTKMAVEDCEKYTPKPTVCENMPAIRPDYDLKLDALNRAPSGRAFVFTVAGERYKGWTGSTAMAGAKVSVSYDDGATWQSATTERKNDHTFQVVAKHPELAATNGFVSLKTEVWDAAGSRTVQTVHRAYALK